MKKVQLGTTGIQISAMGYGNVDFGTNVTKEKAFEILDAFYRAGGNFIDTSNNYSVWTPGASGDECENVIGEWISSRGVRDKIVLSTKVGARPVNKKSLELPNGELVGDWYLKGEGLSKQAIRSAVEGSLKRLRTDYIDLYFGHVEDKGTPIEETMEAFDQLKREGKIRAVGLSNHPTWKVERARNYAKEHSSVDISALQDLHTFLIPNQNRGPRFASYEERDYLRENPGVTLVSYTPTIWGKYAHMDRDSGAEFWGEFYSQENQQRLEALWAIADERKLKPIQVVYAWLLQSSPASVPLIATTSVAHLHENLATQDINLSEEELSMMDLHQQ